MFQGHLAIVGPTGQVIRELHLTTQTHVHSEHAPLVASFVQSSFCSLKMKHWVQKVGLRKMYAHLYELVQVLVELLDALVLGLSVAKLPADLLEASTLPE